MAVRKIATEIALTGEREFNDQMKAVNSNLGAMKAEMSAVSSEFRENAQSTEALKAKQKLLQDTYDQQKEKVRLLQEMLKKTESAYGTNSAQADKYRKQLASATVSMNKAEDALKANDKELSQHGTLLDRAGDKFSTAKKQVKEFAEAAADAAKKTPVLGDAIKVTSAAADAAGKSFAAVAKGAAMLATAGVAAAGALSAVAVAGMQTLTKYATDAAKQSQESYEKAVELHQKALEAAAAGNAELAAQYEQQSMLAAAAVDDNALALSKNLDRLETATQRAKNALGGILIPALSDLSGEGAHLLNMFTLEMNACEGDTERMGEVMAKYIRKAVALLRQQAPQFLKLGGELLSGLGQGIVDNLPAILEDAGEIVELLLTTLEDRADDLGEVAALLITEFANFLISASPELLEAGIDLITQLVLGLAEAAPTLIAKAPEIIQRLLTSLVQNAPQLILAGLQLVLAIIKGLVEAIPQLIAMIPDLLRQLKESFLERIGDFSDIGVQIVEGIKAGFLAVWDSLVSTVRGLFANLRGSIQMDEGIHSPSTRWRDEIGKQDAAGFGEGFVDELDVQSRRIRRAVTDVMPDAEETSFSVAAPGGSGGQGSVNYGDISINVYGAEGQDIEELAEVVCYKLKEIIERSVPWK